MSVFDAPNILIAPVIFKTNPYLIKVIKNIQKSSRDKYSIKNI